MISITDYIQNNILKDSSILELLNAGLLNTTQYSNIIKPQIEKSLHKNVTQTSIITALSRIKKKKLLSKTMDFKIDDIQILYPISDLVFTTKFNPTNCISTLYAKLADKPNHFLNLTVGNSELNIFVNTKYKEIVTDIFVDNFTSSIAKNKETEKLIYERNNLCSINLKFDSKYIDTPGTTYQLLRVLAWNNINLVEVVSTFSEVTLFVDRNDSQLVLELLTDEFMV